MAKLLFAVGRFCFHKKWAVLGIWLVLLAAILGSGAVFQKPFSNDFSIPDMPSSNAAVMIGELWPNEPNPVSAPSVNIVFQAPEGRTLDDYMPVMDETVAEITENLPDFYTDGTFANPVTLEPQLTSTVYEAEIAQGLPEETAKKDAANLSRLTADHRTGYTSFTVNVSSMGDVTAEHREVITAALEKARESGLRVEANGTGYSDPIRIKTTSEIIGLVVALIVLIVTFGALFSAGVPILTALVGVGIGMGFILLATRMSPLNNTTPVLAMMIGLAVGIDYTLFILARYRVEKHRMPLDEAAGMAVGTAGSSVLFAGATVFVALAALTVVGIPFLSWMGITAAATVLVSVLVAITLLPAVLGILGDRIFKGRVKFIPEEPKDPTMGRRWVRFVHRFPALVLAGVIVLLGAATYPASHLQLLLPFDSTGAPETTQRQAADLMDEAFGPGINSPFLVVADLRTVNPEAEALQPLGGNEQAALMYAVQTFQANPTVKHVQIAGLNQEGTAARLLITPETGPKDPSTTALLTALRDQQANIEQATGMTMGITGFAAVFSDITSVLREAMPIYLGIVVGLAIILLIGVFRSIMVPVVAGLGFLLSMGASFGVTVLFWQDGLWGLVGNPQPIISFMPIFLIGVCFGLAMDYQVFLVSRMREHYTHSGGVAREGSPYTGVEESVVEGFTQGARVVTAAALIMIIVFIAAIDQPLAFVQVFGFALGFGVLFDAFFVRMALIPASMFLLGRATWYLPKWVDKIAPPMDIEGAALEREWELKHGGHAEVHSS